MKKITKQFLFCALSFAALTFVSCDDDDATGDSTINVTSGVVGTIGLVSPLAATQTVDEAEGTYEFTVTLSHTQPVDVQVQVIQTAGSAVPGEDFDFSSIVTIPAYTLVGTGTIDVLENCGNPNDSNFTLQIGSITTSNATVNPMTVSFEIENSLEASLELAFQFNKSFSIAGTAYTLCGIGYDMDYYVLDANDEIIPDYSAATGACIEKLNMDLESYPNGTYTIAYDIYDDGGLSNQYHDPFAIPITVDYYRCGSALQGSYVEEGAVSSTDGSGSGTVVKVEILDGVYTLVSAAGDDIATGKHSNKIKAAIEVARKNRK